MPTLIPDKDIFVKVHNDARSTAAGCYGKVVRVFDKQYLIVYAKPNGDIMPPVWVDKKYCIEIPPTTEIEIEETT